LETGCPSRQETILILENPSSSGWIFYPRLLVHRFIFTKSQPNHNKKNWHQGLLGFPESEVRSLFSILAMVPFRGNGSGRSTRRVDDNKS
jgi:hypothetical protein